VAGPYKPYDDDMAVFDGLTVDESRSDTCPVAGKWYEDTWPNLEAPRVTHYLVIGFIYKMNWEFAGFDPRTSATASAFARPPDHWATGYFLFYIHVLIYLNSLYVTYGRGRTGA
jgi:hypothetical protein